MLTSYPVQVIMKILFLFYQDVPWHVLLPYHDPRKSWGSINWLRAKQPAQQVRSIDINRLDPTSAVNPFNTAPISIGAVFLCLSDLLEHVKILLMNKVLPENIRETTPTVFVIFGATGDLSLSKLIPALHDLFLKDILPLKYEIVAFARRPFSDASFRDLVKQEILKKEGDHQKIDIFLERVCFVQGLFDTIASFENLGEYLQKIDESKFGACSNKLFYLAVPPNFYESIIVNLSSSGLTIPCGGNEGWTRVLIEKPFGQNLATAEKLDLLLGKLFEEKQVFRIDHYLAKETIQNILSFRFGNGMFESLWDNRNIAKVEIDLFEKSGVSGRGAFYDSVGALRDVGQNHMLQMYALVAMERPEVFDADSIRKSRARALLNLKPMTQKGVSTEVVRMRYKGYLKEAGVASDSNTETFFSFTAFSKEAHLKDIPFIFSSGKGLDRRETVIRIHFKNSDTLILDENGKPIQNILTFRIQPNEGIDLVFASKKQNRVSSVEERTLSFEYSSIDSGVKSLDAYEKVLIDAVRGDQTLFISTEEIRAEWEFITSIIDKWDALPISEYEQGTSPINLKINSNNSIR